MWVQLGLVGNLNTYETDSGLIHQVPENQLTEDIRRLLHLAGFSEDIYFSISFGGGSFSCLCEMSVQ